MVFRFSNGYSNHLFVHQNAWIDIRRPAQKVSNGQTEQKDMHGNKFPVAFFYGQHL